MRLAGRYLKVYIPMSSIATSVRLTRTSLALALSAFAVTAFAGCGSDTSAGPEGVSKLAYAPNPFGDDQDEMDVTFTTTGPARAGFQYVVLLTIDNGGGELDCTPGGVSSSPSFVAAPVQIEGERDRAYTVTLKANDTFGDYFCSGDANLVVSSVSIEDPSRETSRSLRELAFRIESSGSADDAPTTTDAATLLAPEEQCVNQWNRRADAGMKGVVSITFGEENDYVSVGFSETFPDRCLITVANPDRGWAAQYLETRTGGFRMLGDPGDQVFPIDNLDPSVTDWNAYADEGFLTYLG